MTNQTSKLAAFVAVGLALSAVAVGPADARRGGSFGSRGTRTYSTPTATQTAPGYVPPVQRSMTQAPSPALAPAYGQQYRGGRPGFLGGFGGGLLGGLLVGGLIGGMMGHGWGGGGLPTILLQIAIVAGIVWLVLRLFRRPTMAVQGPSFGQQAWGPATTGGAPFGGLAQTSLPLNNPALQIPIGQDDRDAFERLLIEVQDAFGHEDYGRLRERTTPEVMSYLAEELSQNATQGRRNDVTGTRLIQSDVSESWREGDADYATVALRYESVDVMRDRASGAVVAGDPGRPTEATELWTFVRQAGVAWKLSAIQET
jgi:predicted lipid-binding transport protein (Tim44 family)